MRQVLALITRVISQVYGIYGAAGRKGFQSNT